MPKSKSIRKRLPSAKYLRACFTYDPKTGILRWKRRPLSHFSSLSIGKMWNAQNAETIAGSVVKRKYYQINFDHQKYQAHRIIWKFVTGTEPPISIDHKDGNGFNNRWANLRVADNQKQGWNTGRNKNNTSGYKGISRDGSKWLMTIRIRYATIEEAVKAYEGIVRKLHGKFYRSSS